MVDLRDSGSIEQVAEVAPRVTFPEEDDYEINPGIIIKLEATFGYKTDEDVYKKIFF